MKIVLARRVGGWCRNPDCKTATSGLSQRQYRCWVRELSETTNEGGGDPWLKAALKVTDYGFTQTIAAASQLADRWNNAGPYARAY